MSDIPAFTIPPALAARSRLAVDVLFAVIDDAELGVPGDHEAMRAGLRRAFEINLELADGSTFPQEVRDMLLVSAGTCLSAPLYLLDPDPEVRQPIIERLRQTLSFNVSFAEATE